MPLTPSKLFKREKKSRKPVTPRLPLYAYILYGIAAMALVVYALAACLPAFADGFNGSVGAFFRALLGYLTGWLPFSLAEILLLFASPLLVVGICILTWKKCSDWRRMLRFLACFLSLVSIFFSLFVFSFGTGYHTTPLDARLDLGGGEVTAEKLAATAEKLLAELSALSAEITYAESGFSVRPYDHTAMNEKLLSAYSLTTSNYDFIQDLHVPTKPVLASKAMSYTHITGVYTYFTGEANINTHFPDYTLPFTAAHELAHQRGIARENEANFVAFLVCEASDDPYIRYSGYLNLFEYVSSALYYADRDAHGEMKNRIPPAVMGELRAYADFFETYRDSAAADLSDAVNDTYLKLHGNTAGSASYGLVVELAVAYFT